MNIQITMRHAKSSQGLRETLTEELKNLEKFADKITSIHAVIDSEHVDKKVEIVANLSRHTVTATAKSDNLGKAVDKALDKITAQLKKVNQRRKEHKREKTTYKEDIAG